MTFKEQMDQIALAYNSLEIRTRYSTNKDIQDLTPYFSKLFLSYNSLLRNLCKKVNTLEKTITTKKAVTTKSKKAAGE